MRGDAEARVTATVWEGLKYLPNLELFVITRRGYNPSRLLFPESNERTGPSVREDCYGNHRCERVVDEEITFVSRRNANIDRKVFELACDDAISFESLRRHPEGTQIAVC